MTNEKYDRLLTEALTLYKSRQLESIPSEDEIDYAFSQDFQKKAKKLIDKQEKSVRRFFQSSGRKAAAIILALIIGLTATLSIDAVREPIFKFIYRVFSTHTEIDYDKYSGRNISEYYTLPKVPDGFKKTDNTLFGDAGAFIFLENSVGEIIQLSQFADTFTSSINSEGYELKTKQINGIDTLFCDNTYCIFCFWEEHGNYFQLNYPSNLGEEFMDEVIGKLIAIDDPNQF